MSAFRYFLNPAARRFWVMAGVAGGLAYTRDEWASRTRALGFGGCCNKEKTDWDAVKKAIAGTIDDYETNEVKNSSWGPMYVRLAWHMSGTYCQYSKTGGSDGCTMLFDTEANDPANAGLGKAINRLGKLQEEQFPDVSKADFFTLAGVVAVEEMGGPNVDWSPGRSDAKDSSKVPPNGRLPDATQGASHLRDVFYRMGFNDQEIVALAGAHTLGNCHPDRSGFDGPWTDAPTTFSNLFFKDLKEKKWTIGQEPNGAIQYRDENKVNMMLPTDMALLDDPSFKKWVDVYADDEQAFRKDFSVAFAKLLSLNQKKKCPIKCGGSGLAVLSTGVLGTLVASGALCSLRAIFAGGKADEGEGSDEAAE